MTLQEKIDALPQYHHPEGHVDWYAARLALAREWIEQTHGPDCQFITNLQYWPVVREAPCTCGRDALLKALETP